MNANYWVRAMGSEGFYIRREDHVSAFFQVPKGVDMDSNEYGQMLVDSLPDDDTIKAIARHGAEDSDNLLLARWGGWFAGVILGSFVSAMAGLGLGGIPLVLATALVLGSVSRRAFRRHQATRELPRHVLDPNFIFRHHPARTDSMHPLCRRQDYER